MRSAWLDRSRRLAALSALLAVLTPCLLPGQGAATQQVTLQIRDGLVIDHCPDAKFNGPKRLTLHQGVDCKALFGRVPKLDNVQGISALVEKYATALYTGDKNTVEKLWVHDRQPMPDVTAVHNGCGIKDVD